MRYQSFRYLPVGDCAITVEIGDEIAPNMNAVVRALTLALEQRQIPGVREFVPTYRSITVIYDPAVILFHKLVEHIKQAETSFPSFAPPPARIIEIPVQYGGEFGVDIGTVAAHNHLSEDEVIALHSGRDYLVYMLGFTPGFCYLGGLDERLETPRLDVPRTRIPAGSVGIAGKQTGIYPIDSPGGWQLIGRTALRLFDPQREPPVFINAGDLVRFVPIK